MDKLTPKQLATIYGALGDWWGVERGDQVFKNVVAETGHEPICADDDRISELYEIKWIVLKALADDAKQSGQETSYGGR